MSMPRAPIRAVLLGALLIAGCGEGEGPETDTVAVTDRPAEQAARPDALPPRIYYDLTTYGWYQRAEPLAAAGNEYVPHGEPVAIPLAKLRSAGNYQGVDYYVTHDAEEPPATVYVPVYRGYWLRFHAAPAATE